MSLESNKKILFFDIETAPTLAWIWRTGKQYISHSQIKDNQRTGIICICYKFLNEDKVRALNWGSDDQSSEKMIEEFSRVVASADLIVGHNGDRFDMRHINTQRLLNNQPPISWPTSEDTLKQFRKVFFLPSYSLDYISKLLTGSGKDRMEFRDWIDIVQDKKALALKKMISYCKKDVLKLEQIWRKASKYCQVKIHQGVAAGVGRESCPRCASEAFIKDGFKLTRIGRQQRYQCKECSYKWTDSRRF